MRNRRMLTLIGMWLTALSPVVRPQVMFPQLVPDTFKLPGSASASAQFDPRVNLDVIVTNKAGKPETGLQQSDFIVLDNKQPVKLTSFEAAPGGESPEIILLIDNVNSPFTLMAQIREQVKNFLRRNGGKLERPIKLIFLTDDGISMQPSSRDGAELARALDATATGLRTVNRTQGAFGAVDRFRMSMNALMSVVGTEKQKPGKKMLIWIGPGWPMLSGPNVQLTSKEEKELFHNVTVISAALREARIVLYSIDPIGVADAGSLRTSWYKAFVKGLKSAKGTEFGNLALPVIAEQSGGRAVSSGNDVASEIASCTTDAAAWYVLSFEAPPADGPNEYHVLTVKLDKSGLFARTRAGYYDQP